MRLLWFNLATDLDDPILAFTNSWIRAMAKKVDFIHVITMRLGRTELPENVQIYSVGKEKQFGEPRRAWEFYRLIFRILHQESIDVCFSHMIPIFTILGYLPLKLHGVPIITWYAHRQRSFKLRLAHHLSDRMVSTNARSYPYKSSKLQTLGQGIDTGLFKPNTTISPADPPLILFVGRLSPIKDPLTFIRAARLLSNTHRFQVAVIGQILEHDREYSRVVLKEIELLRKTVPVELIPGMGQNQLVSWYQKCFAVVNCSPSDHSLDKTVLETMACGKLALTSILGFEETMGQEVPSLLFQSSDPQDLADKLENLLKLPGQTIREMSNGLREQTLQNHSLGNLAENLNALLHQLKE